MNTTQNPRHIIAAVVVAGTSSLLLGACAQGPVPAPLERLSIARIAELRSGQLELAERRAEMYHRLAELRNLNDLRHEVMRAENRVEALELSTERTDVDPSVVDAPRTLQLPLVQLERLHELGH